MYSNVVWNDARYISLSMVKYNYHIKASQPIRKESYMAEKRKDDKKRNLFTGESQRKDGTYMYRYTDMFGKRHSVYAPTLNDLRIKEKQIQRDLDDGLSIKGGETTVGELLDIYLKTNKQWKPSTRVGKESRVKIIKEYPISTMRLNEVKQSHVQAFFIQLFDKGVKANSISVYKAVLRPAFQKAVDDDLIRKNPCLFSIDFLQKEENTKVALSQKEEKLFLEFVKQNKKLNWYYDIYVLMLETGLRLGDADGKISLNQQKPSKHAGLRRFGPEKFLQRNNEFMKERPIFYKKPIKTEKDFSTWLRCFYYTTKAVITEYIYF